MSVELPQGWATAPLGELSKPTRPRRNPQDYSRLRFVGMEQVESHTLRLIGTLPSSEMKSTAIQFQPGDVLYGRLRPYLNKVLCTSIEGLCSSEFIALPAGSAFESKYLAFYLSTAGFVSFANQLNQGDRPRVSFDQIARYEIPLAPLAEQRRIVAKLEKVLGKVDECQKRLAKIPVLLKRFRQSILAAACSGRLTADWRKENRGEDAANLIEAARSKRPKKFQDDSVRIDLDLPELPETWAWTNLRFLLSPAESFCYGVVQPGEDDPNGVFLVRAGNLKGGRVEARALRRIPRRIHEAYRRSQLNGGEILVTVVGAGIGETAIAQQECAGFNIARAVAKLPVREFQARYVHLWLTTNRAVGWMKGDSREVARPTLNLEQLQTLPVPMPPSPEQQKIVRQVEALFALADQLEARYAKAKSHVEKLTQSILAKAFRGELVPQDPSDEPAARLLERIRTIR